MEENKVNGPLKAAYKAMTRYDQQEHLASLRATMDTNFVPGATVKLKSGSPVMTISHFEKVHGQEQAVCVWFTGQWPSEEANQVWLGIEALDLVKE